MGIPDQAHLIGDGIKIIRCRNEVISTGWMRWCGATRPKQRAAYLITHDAGLAEDVMQSAFVQMVDRIHQFDSARCFEPWFMRIVVNMALKSVGRNANHLPLDLEAADWLPDPQPGPAAALETADLERAVREALLALTPEQRAVIVLRYYLGYTEREMSQELGSPVGTIRWRLHAARKMLRGLLHNLNRPAQRSKGRAMNEAQLAQILHTIAAKEMTTWTGSKRSDDVCWPQQAAKTRQRTRVTAALALILLLISATVAYAVYQIASDPGLESVRRPGWSLN
jgi:RNA polymerase sigma-70 factor (ECF subfamily)